ncbi:hypothetical protein NHQ30_010477 [Ciborinia camelliae]|nr:hypothetical protein NHQ30_010477 [Ciborinia camelliae]
MAQMAEFSHDAGSNLSFVDEQRKRSGKERSENKGVDIHGIILHAILMQSSYTGDILESPSDIRERGTATMALLVFPKSSTIVAVEPVNLPTLLKESAINDPEKGTTPSPITLPSTFISLPTSIRKSPCNPILTTLSSFTLTLSTWGFYNSSGILLSHLSTTVLPHTPLPALSLIPALNILLTLLLFLPLGPVYDAFGPLPLLIPGSLIYILSLLLLSLCSSLLHFLLVYGMLSALGMALLCTVANTMLNTFEGTGYRGLVTGIALVENPTGGIIFTFMFKTVLENLEWGDAMRIVAGVVGVLIAVGFLAFLLFARMGEKGARERDESLSTNETTRSLRWKFWNERKIQGD